MELYSNYIKWAQEDDYKDFVQYENTSGQFDFDNSFPSAPKSVNVRSTKTEIVGTSGLHPTHEGYMQIADATF